MRAEASETPRKAFLLKNEVSVWISASNVVSFEMLTNREFQIFFFAAFAKLFIIFSKILLRALFVQFDVISISEINNESYKTNRHLPLTEWVEWNSAAVFNKVSCRIKNDENGLNVKLVTISTFVFRLQLAMSHITRTTATWQCPIFSMPSTKWSRFWRSKVCRMI